MSSLPRGQLYGVCRCPTLASTWGRPWQVTRRWAIRIASMILGNAIGRVLDMLNRLPHSLLWPVSYPLHIILQPPLDNPRINDLLYLILQLSFNLHRRRAILRATSQSALLVGLQHDT